VGIDGRVSATPQLQVAMHTGSQVDQLSELGYPISGPDGVLLLIHSKPGSVGWCLTHNHCTIKLALRRGLDK